MTAGFQSQPPFRKRLGRHRTRFSLFSADRVSAFQQLADPQRTQNSRNQGPVAKVGLIKRLHELRQQKLTRDQLLIKLGAARKEAGPAAWRIIDIQVA